MNKTGILTIILIGWIIAGTYFYTCVWCELCGGGTPNIESYQELDNRNPNIIGLKIEDGSDLNSFSNENLIFNRSNSGAIIKSSVQRCLTELGTYLKGNPGKTVYLTGLYKSNENTVKGFNNLGSARAAEIKRNLLSQGVKDTQIVTGSKVANDLYESGDLIYGAVDFAFNKPSGFAEAAASKPGTMIQDGDLNININNDAVLFDNSSDRPKISTNISNKLAEVANYLKANKNRVLQLTGFYARNEKNNTQQPNLGLARAEALKKEIVAKGADQNQINTTYAIRPIPSKTGFVEYSFKTKQEIANYEKEMLAKVQSNIEKIGSMNVYFETGSDNIALNDDLANFIDDVKYYLAKKPNQKVKLIGHTDNVGNAQSNTTLGLERAKTIKTYFVRGGVKANQIATSSEGPNKPIATNDTDDGRAKNRRVEISIK